MKPATFDAIVQHNHACRIRKVCGYYEVQTKEPGEPWSRYCGGFARKHEAQGRIDAYRESAWFPAHMIQVP